MSNHRPKHILFWRNVKYYPKLSSNTPRLSLSRSLLALLLETYIWCIDYYMYDSFQNAKHMVWLRSKKKYALHCTLIWRRSLISDYVVYFIFIFLKESKLESSLIRDFNIKNLNLSRVAGSSPTGDTALCPSARHMNICLELNQPKKTHPNMFSVEFIYVLYCFRKHFTHYLPK